MNRKEPTADYNSTDERRGATIKVDAPRQRAPILARDSQRLKEQAGDDPGSTHTRPTETMQDSAGPDVSKI